MNIAEQAKQQKIALNAILAEIQEQLKYFQGPKFYTDTSVQTHEITSRLRTLKEQAEKGLEGITIKSGDDYNSGKKLEDFGRGVLVNVHARSTDEFQNFTGIVLNRDFVHDEMQVEDKENCIAWICKPSQCSFSSDDVMHGE